MSRIGRPPKPQPERFWDWVEEGENDCWEWSGPKGGSGYGRFYQGRSYKPIWVAAHRWAYEALVAPIAEGLTIDHVCRNPLCVNPGHLEPVTMRENTHRGNSPGALMRRTGRCQRGHLMEGDNVIYRSRPGREWRECRECFRLGNRERKRRYRKEAANV